MRYGIFSDIHSNLEALEAVIAAYKKESIDSYLCAGDVVGYASNPNECNRIISSLVQNCVAGNHDWASLGIFPAGYFNEDAVEAVTWTRAHLDEESLAFLKSLKLVYRNDYLTVVHGTLNEPQEFDYLDGLSAAEETFRLFGSRVCFLGHTHLPGIFAQDKDGSCHEFREPRCRIEEGRKYIVNVGSVGQPRDRDPRAAYCVYDTESGDLQIKRAEYDVNSTRKKVSSAGLPAFLGERLLTGR